MIVRSSNDHSTGGADPATIRAVASRPTRPALRDRYDRRQAQVVVDAARVFAGRGYDQTSVPQLADELGVAAGSLYHYFGGKEELLIAICDQLMEPLHAEARDLVADDDIDPTEQLRALVRIWVRHVVEHRDHMLVFQQERHVIDHGDQWRHVRDSRKRFERLVEGVLARLHDEGGARLEDPRLSLAALLGMVNHTAQWYRPRGRLTPAEIADGYVALILRPATG
jgi:AcrR family transcriptional regulator